MKEEEEMKSVIQAASEFLRQRNYKLTCTPEDYDKIILDLFASGWSIANLNVFFKGETYFEQTLSELREPGYIEDLIRKTHTTKK